MIVKSVSVEGIALKLDFQTLKTLVMKDSSVTNLLLLQLQWMPLKEISALLEVSVFRDHQKQRIVYLELITLVKEHQQLQVALIVTLVPIVQDLLPVLLLETVMPVTTALEQLTTPSNSSCPPATSHSLEQSKKKTAPLGPTNRRSPSPPASPANPATPVRTSRPSTWTTAPLASTAWPPPRAGPPAQLARTVPSSTCRRWLTATPSRKATTVRAQGSPPSLRCPSAGRECSAPEESWTRLWPPTSALQATIATGGRPSRAPLALTTQPLAPASWATALLATLASTAPRSDSRPSRETATKASIAQLAATPIDLPLSALLESSVLLELVSLLSVQEALTKTKRTLQNAKNALLVTSALLTWLLIQIVQLVITAQQEALLLQFVQLELSMRLILELTLTIVFLVLQQTH